MQSQARFDLRAATHEPHVRLDSAFSALNLAAREDYRRFLIVHGRVIPVLEQVVEAGRAWSEWSPRAHLLRDDLVALGAAAPVVDGSPPDVTEAERWGVQYVLEGSKLGGEVLAKQVAGGLPRRYLNAGHQKGGWSRFQAELQSAAEAGGPDWRERAAEAARSAFGRFEAALKIELGQARGR